MKYRISFIATLIALTSSVTTQAQTSAASAAQAQATAHTTVPFRTTDAGTKLPDIIWGLDQAWIDEGNMRRGVNFAGADMIGIVRLSFQTDTPLNNGELTSKQKQTLNRRLEYAKYAPNATINLNSDQEAGVDSYYHVFRSEEHVSTFAPRWAELIAVTKRYVESKGRTVSSVSPFNEPDYGEGQTWGWHQGSKAEMREICRLLREDDAYREEFKDIKLCGGNTLNNDKAADWYNYSKDYLDEGNTHQLAGEFSTFASFYELVKADGKTGVDDELHNTMEAMVGSNYGMTKGIWWGTCEETRSQFMKASRGTRLGYAENRGNWTAASVYRHTNGNIQAFAGASERQATETRFRFAALDHDIFVNGVGPTREYVMTIPGGKGYQIEQTNAEKVVDVQGGDDIMPAISGKAGTYKIVNAHSGLYISTSGNNPSSGANLAQLKSASGNAGKAQQWIITPLADEVLARGDTMSLDIFEYITITNVRYPNLAWDVKNWSLSHLGQVMLWENSNHGTNEQWALEYAGDSWFYIRNRHSGLYLAVTPGTDAQMKLASRTLVQCEFTGDATQKWRFIQSTAFYDAVAPAAPTDLTATASAASVNLNWTAPADRDLKSYNVQRSDNGTDWYVIYKDLTETAYTDNTALSGKTYSYRIQAEDNAQNRSEASNVVRAKATGAHACILNISCDSLTDLSGQGNHAALAGSANYVTGKLGQALRFDGKTNYMQLPATIASSRELTISAWVYYRGGDKWQRIFDFGTDTEHYMFLTPNNSYTTKMRLALKNGGTEQWMDYTSTLNLMKWTHIAITFSDDAITLYINGTPVITNTSINIRPSDIMPISNCIGRSTFPADPLFKGEIDDVRIYNYALSADEINAIMEDVTPINSLPSTLNPAPSTQDIYTIGGQRIPAKLMRPGHIYIMGGKKVRAN